MTHKSLGLLLMIVCYAFATALFLWLMAGFPTITAPGFPVVG